MAIPSNPRSRPKTTTKNVYFNNYNQSAEQTLYEDLYIESISIYGQQMYYLPRTQISKDELYGEDDVSKYEKAIQLEFYIRSVDGFEGDGQFLSKFGLEIRDQVVLSVARRRFEEEITSVDNDIIRPREGDLIWFPFNEKPFVIRFVNQKPFFYPFGALPFYDLTCELFEYSHEQFNTGIEEIDEIETKFSGNIIDHAIQDDQGNPLVDDQGNYILFNESTYNPEAVDNNTDNDQIQVEANNVLYWDEIDPWSEGNY